MVIPNYRQQLNAIKRFMTWDDPIDEDDTIAYESAW
jgi:hypothetical protein